MKRLLRFIDRYKDFLVFVCLELVCIGLVTHRKAYENSSTYNRVIGNVQQVTGIVARYACLHAENDQLLSENALLKNQLLQIASSKDPLDAAVPCHFVSARVINNTIVGTQNHLTLNKGALHGIAPGMGVVGSEGIVGRVKTVSDHFAVVTSLLHTAMQVSAKVLPPHVLGTVQWLGLDPCRAQVLYVPRHIPVKSGDMVVTSGYNATFCEGIPIGRIRQVTLREEAYFYEIELHLSTNFSTLRYVYVVRNDLKHEQDVLEQRTRDFYE